MPGVEGGGVLGLIFGWYVPLASQSPYPITVYSVANYRPHLSHFNKYLIFSIPTSSLSIFMNWPCFRLNEEHFTFHLQYKHSGTFANRKYEERSYPKKAENVRPILKKLSENATTL